MRRYSSSLILLAILIATARADITTTWNGTTGNWTDATRWSGGAFPNNSAPNTYHAVINSGTVTLAQAVELIAVRAAMGGGKKKAKSAGRKARAVAVAETVTVPRAEKPKSEKKPRKSKKAEAQT